MTRSGQQRHFGPRASAFAIAGLFWLLPLAARAATFYVAPTGSDNNAGTSLDAPFATMARGQEAAAGGDTVYFRGGTYKFTSNSAANGVALSKSGSSGKRINYWAYQAEVPIFDFSGMTAAARITGLRVTASWIHLKGFEIKLVPQNITTANESWGVHNVGSNNVFEMLNLHHNMGPGFFLGGGGNNLILNCDSHHNYDPKSIAGDGENADGFGCHPAKASDTGNVYRGIRAWWNTDDGFDAISAQAACVVENSWAWYNGYLPDKMTEPMRKPTTPPGNGNGFKLGGFGLDASGSPAVPPKHRISYSVAFLNVYAGFFANYHTSGNYYYDNTGFGNGADFDMMGLNNVNTSVLRNNVALGPLPTRNMKGTDSSSNSWDLPVVASEADFQSVSIVGMDGPRQPDGSLPVVPFMRLAAGSHLIDKGIKVDNITVAFSGTAPDLGAFESGGAVGGGGNGGAAGSGAAGSSAAGSGTSGSAGLSGSAGGAAGAPNGGTPATSGGSDTAGGSSGSPSSGPAGAANLAGSSGSTPNANGGSPSAAGASDNAPASSDNGGCGCHVGSAPSNGAFALLAAAGLAAQLGLRRRRRNA